MKYIDTSAFVKYYAIEEFEKGAQKIAKIFEDTFKGKTVLVTSALLLGEIVSAFDKWHRIGAVSESQLDILLKRLFFDIKELTERGALIVEPIDPMLPLFTVELILKHHVSVNDAVHLYTALKHSGEATEFICSDKNLISAAKAEGLKVFNPEE